MNKKKYLPLPPDTPSPQYEDLPELTEEELERADRYQLDTSTEMGELHKEEHHSDGNSGKQS
jgi:hypothetical protein